MSSTVLGAMNTVREENTMVLALGMLTLCLGGGLKWPFFLQKPAGSLDNWSANKRRPHLEGKGKKDKDAEN